MPLGEAVGITTDSVIAGAVGVIVGMLFAISPPFKDDGGKLANPAVADAGMSFAPAPPVIHDSRGGVQSTYVAPGRFNSAAKERQAPEEVVGSVGIQPCSKPREYDHNGLGTSPVELALIFQVQKNLRKA